MDAEATWFLFIAVFFKTFFYKFAMGDFRLLFFVYSVVIIDVAAPGDVVDKVKIERENESTVVFTEGARNAYIGYVTIKVKCTSCSHHHNSDDVH